MPDCSSRHDPGGDLRIQRHRYLWGVHLCWFGRGFSLPDVMVRPPLVPPLTPRMHLSPTPNSNSLTWPPTGQCSRMWWTISNCRTPNLSATRPSSTLSMSSSPSSPLGSLWAFPLSVCSKYQRHRAWNSYIFYKLHKANLRHGPQQLQHPSPLNIIFTIFFLITHPGLKTSLSATPNIQE